MRILGISAYYHDSAVALVEDDLVVAACQEERFTRNKHDNSFPIESLKYIIESYQLSIKDIEAFVFYEKPLLKFDRIIENYLAFSPKGFLNFRDSLPLWSRSKIFQKSDISRNISKLLNCKVAEIAPKVKFSGHHLSHAASAFFPSPFQEATVVTFDGVGEWATTTIGSASGRELELISQIQYPHSIGLLYSTITAYCGFKVNAGEYKLMGLAPYGNPRYENLIMQKLVNLKSDGSFQLNLDYFDFGVRQNMWSNKLERLLNVKPRKEHQPLTQEYADLAASIQCVTEKLILNVLYEAKRLTKSSNLCLAGGVALNCVANSKILNSGLFQEIWIQPAAGDAGGALGAAMAYYNSVSKKQRPKSIPDAMQSAYLGSEYSRENIISAIETSKSVFSEFDHDALFPFVAGEIANGLSVGWFQGRAEFGPRALGNRSILADPRSPEMQKRLNLQTKFRESFRPFAPSVIESQVENYFEFQKSSPYMLYVANLKSDLLKPSPPRNTSNILEKVNEVRSALPAITHVDNSARIQTVSPDSNPRFYKLLEEFMKLTGFPVLINTSFNIRGEPIVNSPSDALKCFYGTDIDILVLGNCVIRKSENLDRISDYRLNYLND